MTRYRVHGIAETIATAVRTTMQSPQYGHPAHAEVATGPTQAGELGRP